MANHHDKEAPPYEERTGGVSRRSFLHGVIVASAATSASALPTSENVTVTPVPVSITTVLTANQSGALTTVLDRLVPAEGAMPAAGTLGIGGIIDRALGVAPHLRRHVIGILAALPDADELAECPDEALDSRLRDIEQAQPEAFDLLLQATYTAYYGHPRVLQALGGVKSDGDGELQLERFDPGI